MLYILSCIYYVFVVQSDALDPAKLMKRLNALLVAPSNLCRSPVRVRTASAHQDPVTLVSAYLLVVTEWQHSN